jgi:hypothetical protein
MIAPPTSIIPVTMRKTDGAAPRHPAMRRVDSLRRANDDRSAVPAVLSLVSPSTDPNRTSRAALIHSSPMPMRRAHAAFAAPPIMLSP